MTEIYQMSLDLYFKQNFKFKTVQKIKTTYFRQIRSALTYVSDLTK